MTDNVEGETSHRQRPYRAWYVVEVDIAEDREHELYASVNGPFPTEERAEKEKQAKQEAWKSALEEWNDDNPYDFKGWNVVPKLLYDGQIAKLEREDQESYEITTNAADAVAESLLAGDSDE